mgnify:CR=1 FL=1
MISKTYKVNGMTCNGCAGTVNNIIKMQKGVTAVEVKFPENTAEVTFDVAKISEDRIKEVVQMMGYSLN